jgi:hypothetical protein
MRGMSRYGASPATGRSVALAVAATTVATIINSSLEAMTVLLRVK